ncbi:iron chelate uptake ABC transporter family permease subunit [Ancylobacter sonchi]|uniref:FecCD family ABC transporter permease n=1 Tax=Ancylobacter sonchi TaxID=1937790 RepID=UPI001BD32774|nr:iron chelate uptake ABC transporter family permease subunit [Ancylobacter sonchi]MBS7535357.1 iron chelate uptake ABC transporter family permease subunit [Ancylobacter sonchi]
MSLVRDTVRPAPLRLRVGPAALKLERRMAGVCLALALGAVALALAALCIGTLPVTPLQAGRALIGEGPAAVRLVVTEWRAPRVAGALMVGAALGMAGALFQTLLRNPLGSPDIVGFDAGAFSGALLAMLAGAGPLAVAGAGFGGGLVAGLAVFLLAGAGRRLALILTGIAVGALFTALNDWIILTARLDTALAAASWRLGSLAGIERGRLVAAAALLLVLLPLGLACARTLRALELGEERAASLGEARRPAWTRIALVGLALTATATFLAGPIGFVALIAPQIARSLTRSAGLPLLASALSGAVFLLASDVAGRLLFAPRTIPAGALTAAVGGVYFVALLWMRRTGGAMR